MIWKLFSCLLLSRLNFLIYFVAGRQFRTGLWQLLRLNSTPGLNEVCLWNGILNSPFSFIMWMGLQGHHQLSPNIEENNLILIKDDSVMRTIIQWLPLETIWILIGWQYYSQPMRLKPLQSVNRIIYQNVYLTPHFYPPPLFQMTNIWSLSLSWKYLITFTFIVYLCL